jgi:two-component system CheB/CheR fusion protein
VRTGEPLRCHERVGALGRWFNVLASRVGDAGSLRVAILFSDITARKQAEEALRESEARFRTLVEQVRDYAIFRTDPDGRPTSWNRGVQRVLGFTEAEFLGADIGALIFPPEAIASGVPEQELRTAAERGSASNDRWMQRRTGAPFWASGMTTSLWSEGRLTGFSVVMRDVTEAKRNELLLAEHKHLLELIASNVSLDACLDALSDSIPRLQSGVRAAVLVADGEEQAVGDAFSVHVPPSFAEAVRAAPISQLAMDACGTAMHTGEAVMCADIERSNLLSQPCKELCAAHGIKACYSQPIFGRDAKAVASFVLCFSEARAPDEWERRIAEFGAHIAGIAIERDQTQLALRSALRELRQTMNTAATGLTRCSRDLRYVAANPAYAEMLGLPVDQIVGRPIIDVMGAEAFEAIRPRVERVLRGERVEYEAALPFGALGQRYLHVVYTPWTERGGEADGWVASVTDVTARKQAEQALLEQRRLYQSVTDNASVALFITDAAHRCTFMNPAAEQLTQYNFADVQDQPLHYLVHHTRLDGTPYPLSECPICQAHPLNVRQQGEEVFVRRDGHFYDVAFTASPLRGDSERAIGTVIEVRDITDHKRAERRIAEEGDRSHALISVLTDLPFTADREGRFVALQPAWQAYTGQTWEQSRDFGWAQALHQDDRERVQALWRLACDTHERYFAKGRLWHAPSGEYRHCEARAIPVMDEKGEVREWIGACTDVHERRLAEEALREADRRKDEFLATLAHELRNPLAPMRMAAEVLRRGASERSATLAREVIERQVAAMARLIDDLMDVSRITRGRIELKKEHMTLDTAIRSAVEVTQPLVQSANQQLSLTLPAAPIRVYADPARLTQVLANLLNNAAKYSEPNGRIELEAREEAGTAIVTIRDHGLGIDPAMLGTIWDMFVQADHSLEQSQGGLGIGLTLVRKLVEMHGGAVHAASEGIGRGAAFTVELPIDASWQPGAASGAGDANPQVLAARVLVADDNVDAVKSLKLCLEMWGCQVETANDGRAALDLAARIRPDVALLDLGMPGLTGLDVARGIRRQPWGRETTLVAITGWGQEQDRKRSREAGFDYHLIKPVAPMVLADVLAKRGVDVHRDRC